jgi:hypothetical protein
MPDIEKKINEKSQSEMKDMLFSFVTNSKNKKMKKETGALKKNRS